MNTLKMTFAALALLALAGCVFQPDGDNPSYFGNSGDGDAYVGGYYAPNAHWDGDSGGARDHGFANER